MYIQGQQKDKCAFKLPLTFLLPCMIKPAFNLRENIGIHGPKVQKSAFKV